jgi:UDP-N-acetylmuramoyl-tripeptide--D-alanyl-D-alanine ligase
MSIALSLKELCDVLEIAVPPAAPAKCRFEGIENDSRNIKGGELFIALKGETAHGHDFVNLALSRGAALCLVESLDLAVSEPERLLLVPDTLHAFWKIASYWRAHCAAKIIAVTGSVGKTTVKEMAARILLEQGRGVYSQKSYNNHVGVPYTLCKLSKEHGWAVIEMGMNHAGEISNLSKVTKPDVALITKIAPAHIEYFGSLAAIASAKLEICDGLADGGILIVNGDDPNLDTRGKNINAKTVKFGSKKEFFCCYSDVKSKLLQGISFSLTVDGKTVEIDMNILGIHNAANAAAAACAVKCAFPDTSIEQIANGLKKFTPPLMRLNHFELQNGTHVVDDSYNANPESMRGLLVLAKEFSDSGAKVGLILGDMLELGAESEKEHKAMGVQAGELRPVFMFAVGKYSEKAVLEAKKLGINAVHSNSPNEAAEEALKHKADIILIKASRGTALDKAVLYLQEKVGVVNPMAASRHQQ